MTIHDLLNYGVNELKKNEIEDFFVKARMLLAFCINKDKEYLVIHDDEDVSQKNCEKFYEGIEKLKENIPIQYIINSQDFMKLNFYVDENVLIPRNDTETLVEEVLKLCKNNFKVLDLCTGSGIIGISIKKYKPLIEVIASDVSVEALEVARKNAFLNDCYIRFVESDLFKNIEEKDFDLIVSNPPYISKGDYLNLDKQVKKEPKIALFGGDDGLDFYRKISVDAKKHLKNDGYLCYEIGYNQKEDVIEILKENGYKNIISKKDLYGNDRIVIGQKNI